MKALNYIIISLLIPMSAVAQEKKDISPAKWFDEVSISMNSTLLPNFGSETMGFGAGVYSVWLEDKFYQPVLGVEFNMVSIPVGSVRVNKFTTTKDVEYDLYMLSIPLGMRLALGESVKGYLELGAYADLVLGVEPEGTMVQTIPISTRYEGKYNIKEGAYSNVGVYSGIGLQVPISKYTLGFKPEFRFGLLNFSSNYFTYHDMYARFVVSFGWN